MKKKSNPQKKSKVTDLEPKSANPKGGQVRGGVFVAVGDFNGDGKVDAADYLKPKQ